MSSPLIVSSDMATQPAGTPRPTTNTITNTATPTPTPTRTLPPPPASNPSLPLTPLHHLPLPHRLSFLSSPLIRIYIGPNFHRTIPSALLTPTVLPFRLRSFHLTSTTFIHLPPDTDPYGLTTLVDHLWALTTYPALSTPSPLTQNPNLYTALAVTQASYRLGMGGVTRHVFREVQGYLASEVPAYGEMNEVIYFRKSHPRLWGVMVSTLADEVRREGWGVDGGAFLAFCQDRPVLYEAIVNRTGEREREGREQQAFEMEKYARRELEAREKQGAKGEK